MSKKLNMIGFDAKRIVRNGTGLGSYGRTLVNSLALAAPDTQLLLYAPDKGDGRLRSQVESRPNVRFVHPQGFLGGVPVLSRLWRDYWRTRGMVGNLQRDNVALYHGLSGDLPMGLHRAGIRGVVTIHDLIFLRHPEYYKPLDVFIYKRKFHASLKEAERVVAISECTKRDILAYSDYPADRISVVYQSCGTRFRTKVDAEKQAEVRARYGLPGRYVLNVGTIEERKNVLLAVKALTCDALRDAHLVVVGRPTAYTRRVVQPYMEKMGLEGRVHLLSGVPNDDLPAIYQMAQCFVYPSRYEGFGIPVIEAIQSGLPVVAATGSCLEEAGGPDCLYVSPDDHEAMASAIVRAMAESGPRVERSLQYISRFENADTALRMLDVYAQVLE